MSGPIRVHPDNPKCFEFRGAPLVLLTATEHYGAVMNRPFRYERYLADMADKHLTLTRLFTLFRELQGPANPYSTCKPESPDYVAPFRRTGPGTALDMQPQYDLDQWNPEFFERLHGFLSLASDYGIIVEVVLLSNTYSDAVWSLNPLNCHNNVNGLPEIAWPDYMSLRHPAFWARQAAHIRKIVEETRGYDNVIYETCNEPGGAHPSGPQNPSPEEVNEWLIAIQRLVGEVEQDLPDKHLVVGQEAFHWAPWEQMSTRSFRDFPVEVVNMHPLPNTTLDGASYDMGAFMMKELKLRAVRDFCLHAYGEPKPLNLDEDNAASQYKDFDGWTIHRKRAWATLLSGAHYDYIDFSITNGFETGTPQSQQGIRQWMKHLACFVHSVDLVRARPLPGVLRLQPDHVLECVFGVGGEDYCVYLADEREIGEAGHGEALGGDILLDLPPGSYRIACFAPVTGQYSPWLPMEGGPDTTFTVPEFVHDIVARLVAC